MAEIAYGTGTDPALPPVELPSLDENAPPQIPHIVISPAPREQPKADPWAAYETKPPDVQPVGKAEAAPTRDPWAAYEAPPPDAPPPVRVPQRTVGGEEGAFRGAANAATLGFAPAIAGLAEASGIPSAATKPDQIDINPIRPLIGAYKMLDDWVAGHKNPDVSAAYNRGRENYLGEQKQAEEKHPYAYLAGQLAGALAVPMGAGGAAARAGAGMGRRIIQSAGAGGLTNAAWTTGENVSEGQFDKIPKEALKAAGTGAAFGTVGAAGAEAVGKLGTKVAQIVRGKADTDTEAARRVIENLAKDYEQQGLPLTRGEVAAGKRAGTDLRVIDTGGENTRALARSSANTSPSGRQALTEFTEERFHNQSKRLGQRIRSFIGGGNVADDLDVLNTLSRKANAPAYKKAYAAGAAGHWSPELERLTSSPDVAEALQRAVQSSRSRAVAEGSAGYAPKLKIGPNGELNFTNGNIPDMQLWDYAQRELRQMATAAKTAGEFDRYAYLTMTQQQLLKELDKLNPAFGAARGQAAKFFRASNMLEAGENFVREDINLQHAAKVLRKMNPVDRELFRRGFAAELADQIEKISDKRNVLGSIFVNNGPARQKILLAMGPKDARELEALLRVETVVDEARKAVTGNSTTARQIKEGLMAGGAVGAVEAAKEGDIDPRHLLAGALIWGALSHGAHKIDEKVATRVAEMLLSRDPAVLARGYKIVSNSPALFDALRHATAAGARVGAQNIGPERAGAAALTGLHNVLQVGSTVKGHEQEHRNPNTPDRTADEIDVIPH